MSRKLLLLNLALAAVVAYAGVQFHNQWQAAKDRAAKIPPVHVAPAPPPPYTPPNAPPPVLNAQYAPIAQNMLFHQTRNPTIPVEPPPPPPPPPPVPPLPVYHGQMNLGKGPTVILSVAASSPHMAVHPGEPIGEFKLVDVTQDEIAFDWKGQAIRKKLDEMVTVNAPPPEQVASARTDAPAAPAAPPPPPLKNGPGETTQWGFKTCRMDDGHVDGEVVEGYRKTVHTLPFGKNCTYEPVGR